MAFNRLIGCTAQTGRSVQNGQPIRISTGYRIASRLNISLESLIDHRANGDLMTPKTKIVQLSKFDPVVVGGHIEAVRLKRGWSYVRLSQVSAVSVDAIMAYEHGKRVPTLVDACRLALALKCSVDRIILGKNAHQRTRISRLNFRASALRELIQESGQNESQISRKLNVSRQAVNQWMNGSAMPTFARLLSLAAMFDRPIEFFTEQINSQTDQRKESCQ